jgi:hypothetical protein
MAFFSMALSSPLVLCSFFLNDKLDPLGTRNGFDKDFTGDDLCDFKAS